MRGSEDLFAGDVLAKAIVQLHIAAHMSGKDKERDTELHLVFGTTDTISLLHPRVVIGAVLTILTRSQKLVRKGLVLGPLGPTGPFLSRHIQADQTCYTSGFPGSSGRIFA